MIFPDLGDPWFTISLSGRNSNCLCWCYSVQCQFYSRAKFIKLFITSPLFKNSNPVLIKCWFTSFNFLSFRLLLVNCNGSLWSILVCFSSVITGRWSEISFISSMESKEWCSCSLMYMLSMSVAEWWVILLGLVIVGNRFSSVILLVNCYVCRCSLHFKRSMLWSIPNTISGGVLFLVSFAFLTISANLSWNWLILVLGALYMLPTMIDLPHLLVILMKTDLVSPSTNSSKSVLHLYGIPCLIRMDTPPP